VIVWPVYSDNHQFTKAGCKQKRILFWSTRSGNVIENKGPAWKTPRQCRNVHENTGSWLLNPGMLMKRQGMVSQFAVAAVSERRNSSRIQDRRSETTATKIKLTHYRRLL
jgi:hypothetical protein